MMVSGDLTNILLMIADLLLLVLVIQGTRR